MKIFAFVVAVLFAACSSSDSSPKPAGPANTTSSPLQDHFTAFFRKLSDAVVAANGDCDKLAANIETLAPEGKRVAAEIRAAGSAADQRLTMPPDIAKAFVGDPNILDRCETANPRAKHAIESTLEDFLDLKGAEKAMADALAKASATK